MNHLKLQFEKELSEAYQNMQKYKTLLDKAQDKLESTRNEVKELEEIYFNYKRSVDKFTELIKQCHE